MPRPVHRNDRAAKARRLLALDRFEFRESSGPRVHGSGITSAPMKAEDPATRRMVDEFLARKGAPA